MKVLSCSFQSAWLFAMLSTSCKGVRHIMLSEQEVTMTRVEFDICLYQSRKLPKAVHSATLLRCWARNIAGGTHTQPGLHGFGGRTGYSISRKHLTSPQLFTEWLSSVMSSATVLNYRYVFNQNGNGTDLYQLVFFRKMAVSSESSYYFLDNFFPLARQNFSQFSQSDCSLHLWEHQHHIIIRLLCGLNWRQNSYYTISHSKLVK